MKGDLSFQTVYDLTDADTIIERQVNAVCAALPSNGMLQNESKAVRMCLCSIQTFYMLVIA